MGRHRRTEESNSTPTACRRQIGPRSANRGQPPWDPGVRTEEQVDTKKGLVQYKKDKTAVVQRVFRRIFAGFT